MVFQQDDVVGAGTASQCNKCGAQYPSAPAGVVHKCGACEGGYCSPLSAQHSDLADELRRLLVEYRADPHGRQAFEIAQLFELNADTILTALSAQPTSDLAEEFNRTCFGEGDNRVSIPAELAPRIYTALRSNRAAIAGHLERLLDEYKTYPDSEVMVLCLAEAGAKGVTLGQLRRSLNGGDQYGGMEDSYRAEWKDTINQPQESGHG